MTEHQDDNELELMELTPGQRFHFRCHPGLPCFTNCCQQTTIYLSPYDILRLRRRLGLKTGEFLARYTRREADPDTSLPLVVLDMPGEDKRCPFVTEAGCGVYEDRPTTCRYYPVALGSMMTPQGLTECFAYIQEEHCQGFGADQEWTVESWRVNQGLEEYDAANREWRTVLLGLPVKYIGKITDKIRELFYLAAYDLDSFGPLFLESPIAQLLPLPAEDLARRVADDAELLKLAMKYLRVMVLRQDFREINWAS